MVLAREMGLGLVATALLALGPDARAQCADRGWTLEDATARGLLAEVRAHEAKGAYGAAAESAYRLFIDRYRQHALVDALRAAELTRALAARGDHRRMLLRSHRGLFAALSDLGDLQGARKVIESYRAVAPDDDAQEQSVILQQEGILHSLRHEEHQALRKYAMSLERAGVHCRRDCRYRYRLNILESHFRLGAHDDAERTLREIVADYEFAEDTWPTDALAYWRASIDFARGAHARAETVLRRRLSETKDTLEWRALLSFRLGAVLEAKGETDHAARAYEDAIAAVEAQRRSTRGLDLRGSLLSTRRRPYEALFRLHANAGRWTDALTAYERAKGRTFIDAFVSDSVHWHETGTACTSPERRRAEELEAALPQLARVAAPGLPAAEMLRELRDVHALMYLRVETELWVLRVARGKLAGARLATSQKELRSLVRRFIADPDDVGLANQLGRVLFSRHLPVPKVPGELLHVVADGTLNGLPFAALRFGDAPLIDHYAPALIPNLTALARARRAPPPAGADAPRVLAAGALAGATDEARWVAKRLGVVPHVGDRATRRALFASSRPRVLHVSTHAGVARDPWLALHDERVRASEILRARLAPHLVVVPSCSSAARLGGDFWGSLAATFLAAGARGVVATLWSVEDAAAARLTRAFYRYGGPQRPARALRAAQREAVRARRPAAEWAPFVYLGWSSS